MENINISIISYKIINTKHRMILFNSVKILTLAAISILDTNTIMKV